MNPLSLSPRPGLPVIVTAVDVDELSDDVASLLGCEEDDDVGDVLRLGETAGRVGAAERHERILGVAQTRHRGVRDSGRDGIDADSAWGELAGHAPGAPHDPGL